MWDFCNDEMEISIVVLSKREHAKCNAENLRQGLSAISRTGLFTFRGGKDTDLTAAEFRKIAAICAKAADRLER